MEISFESLGFTQDRLQELVIDRIAEQLLTSRTFGHDGESEFVNSIFKVKLDDKIQKLVDAGIASIAAQHVIPQSRQMIESMVLQMTTEWGEKKGPPMTFTEYLVHRGNYYLTEKVNDSGESKQESNTCSWSGKQTRITYLINAHLSRQIQAAMREALKTVNDSIVGGLQSTAAEIVADLARKTTVKVG